MEKFAGRFQLLRRLGQGGMGEVFLARDLATGESCALKRLAGPASRWGEARRAFEALSRLRHPAVVSLKELGFAPDGTPFYTMEYVPGLPADQALRPGEWRPLIYVAAEVAHALEALHSVGVVHGDLKPSNLLILPGPEPGGFPAGARLLDFGLAALVGQAGEGHQGTPGYAAPEVIGGEGARVPADLYGLGATLFTLITRRPVFEGESVSMVLRKQRTELPSPLPLEEAGAPAGLTQLVLRLLAVEAAERPHDAREVRRELERMDPAARRSLADQLRTEVMVGREKEIATLERVGSHSGHGTRFVTISGETGMGKSALLREIAGRATLSQKSVITLACGSLESKGSAAATLFQRLRSEAGTEASEVTGLSGSARNLLAGTGGTFTEQDLSQLATVTVEFLKALGERERVPYVLLDDADRIDSISRSFIRRVVLHPDTPPGLWIETRRAGGPESESETALWVEAGIARSLPLGPLPREAMASLISARLREPAPQSLVDFLWKRCQGHPGLTVELLLLAARHGALREDEAGLIADPAALETLAVPESFEAAMVARLDGLPEAALRAAAVLAILPEPATPERIQSIEVHAEPRVLAMLIDAGLVLRDDAGRLALLAYQSLGPRVLAKVGEEKRRALHRAALSQPDLSAAERFHHLRGAGDTTGALAAAEEAYENHPQIALTEAAAELAESVQPENAAVWHDRAAKELVEAGRYQGAVDHLDRALELDASGEAGLNRHYELSGVSLRAGLLERASHHIAVALAGHPPPGLRSRLISDEAARLITLGDNQTARTTAEEALALAESLNDDEAIGLAAQPLTFALLRLGDHAAAEAMAERAIEASRSAGLEVRRIRALGAKITVLRALQRLSEAERLCREMLREARALGVRIAIEEALGNLTNILTETGQWDAVRSVAAEAARLALEDNRGRGAAVSIENLAIVEGLTGHPRAARLQARAAIRLSRSHLPLLEGGAWRALAQSHRIKGHYSRGLLVARRALDLAVKGGDPNEIEWSRIEYARGLIDLARWKNAAELLERVIGSIRPEGSVGSTVICALAGQASLRTGDKTAAAAQLAAAEEWLTKHVPPYAEALVTWLRADIAFSEGHLVEGVDQAKKCLAGLLALPAPPDRARAALDFARTTMAARSSQSAPIEEWLEIALSGFERLGDQKGRSRSLTLLVEWLRRSRIPLSAGFRDRNLIQAVSKLLDSLSDLKELAQRAMEMVVDQLNAERGVLLLADFENGRLGPFAEYGAVDADTRSEAMTYSRRVAERVTQSGGSLLIGDAPAEPGSLSESMVDLRLRSIVCVPMYLGGRVIGAVYLDDSRRSQAFSDSDRALLEGFAHLMAVAIENSRGNEEVRRANEQLVGENLSLRKEAAVKFQARRLIGASIEMQRVLPLIERAADTTSTVLITGENGTGKELVARVLHHAGKRRLKPFVSVNCGAIPETLLESELFGILPNIATGVRGRVGYFRQADGGTLFLDEVGEMPLKQQVALLSALANREITPVGAAQSVPVDVRIISATNQDLRRLVEQGAFREDLFYRLNVIPIELPPLRERKADIPALAQHFAAQFAKQQERELPELSPEFMAALMQSDWPGNVRELQNYIERVMAMNPGDVLDPNPLPRDLERRAGAIKLGKGRRLPDLVEEVERRLVEEALVRSRGNQSLAARELGIPEQAVRYRIKKYGLDGTRQNRRIRQK